MSINYENSTSINDEECDYDYFGDTRNNYKHNEEKSYTKNSYNYKIYKKINYTINKKQIQKEQYIKGKEENEKKMKQKLEEQENDECIKNERKRILKTTNIDDINYENNYHKNQPKIKKNKLPKKGRIRF